MAEQPRLIQITGMTGCGKSSLARELILPRPRVIVAEPFSKNSYDSLRFPSVAELAKRMAVVRPNQFRVSVTIDNRADFAWLCALAWVMAPVTLVLDECSLYIPDPWDVPVEFKRICGQGRHAGADEKQPVSVIAIGQRPTNLPPIFRAEVEHWYLFRLNSRRDRKLLEDDMGLTKEIAESAGALRRHHWMKADRFGGVSYGKTRI